MKFVPPSLIAAWLIAATAFLSPAAAQEAPSSEALEQAEEKRTEVYADQLETYLQDWLVNKYADRADKAWNRDYSSLEAYAKSVAPNRERWREVVVRPLPLEKSGELERKPYAPLAKYNAQWLTLPLGGLDAEAILVIPEGATADNPAPLVIAQHGIGSYPEKNFGLLDPRDAYQNVAGQLIDAGFAILAPMNLKGVERRNRIERLCRLADTSLPGIEFTRVQKLLDEVLQDPRVDEDRVGMWGLSLGGLATMFWMPMEPRIKAGVVSGWYNHRRNKMAIPDPRYSCFLDTREEHAFFQGWLTEFTDSDVVSLICPRPIFIQHGKQDRIAHWPQVEEEFNVATTHYEKLGLRDRIELDMHEGGHINNVKPGLAFLKKWLMERPGELPGN